MNFRFKFCYVSSCAIKHKSHVTSMDRRAISMCRKVLLTRIQPT